jgi:hypothetical protein
VRPTDFAEVEAEREAFCERVNTREYRVTRRPPAVMLGEERERMHPLPAVPHTICFGQTRKVDQQSTISVGSAIYSVPSTLVGERVWARAHGNDLIIVQADSPDGPREVARHELTTPGRPSIRVSTIRHGRRVRWSANPGHARGRSRRSWRSGLGSSSSSAGLLVSSCLAS